MEEIISELDQIETGYAGWCWPQPLTTECGAIIAYLFLLASYLTDPVCKVHEFYRGLSLVETLDPSATKVKWLASKFFLSFALLTCGIASLTTTFPGIVLRYLGATLQQDPFHLEGKLPEKALVNNTFRLLSWNICCVGGGYTISDGGVMPWTFRIDPLITEIKKQKAEVICLYELFDTSAAFYLYESLKNDYAHFYFNIGPKPIGVSSGIFVASQYPINNPEFTLFLLKCSSEEPKMRLKASLHLILCPKEKASHGFLPPIFFNIQSSLNIPQMRNEQLEN